MDRTQVDVIIVGAGAAGLIAAKELKKSGKSVCVLEARNRVGGRIKKGQLAGADVDLGGMWTNLEQTPLVELANYYKIELLKQPVVGNSILDMSGKKSYFNPDQMGLPFLANLSLYRAVKKAENASVFVSPEEPWACKKAALWDAQSLQHWINRNVKTQIARDYFQTSMRIEMATEPSQISFLYFLELLNADENSESSQGQWSHKFVGGAHNIFQTIADELGDSIVLDSPVRSVKQLDHGVKVVSDKQTVEAKYVIITAPPRIAARIDYTPSLPAKRDSLMQNMTMGAAIKSFIAYDKPFWLDHGLSGLIINNTAPMSITLDATPEGSECGFIVSMMVGEKALAMSSKSVDERKEALVRLLVENLGPQAAHPVGYVDNDWTTDQWTRGGYASHLPPGVLTMLKKDIRSPNGRIHWAGTELATQWNGLISGAIQSGMREAKAVLHRLR